MLIKSTTGADPTYSNVRLSHICWVFIQNFLQMKNELHDQLITITFGSFNRTLTPLICVTYGLIEKVKVTQKVNVITNARSKSDYIKRL